MVTFDSSGRRGHHPRLLESTPYSQGDGFPIGVGNDGLREGWIPSRGSGMTDRMRDGFILEAYFWADWGWG